MSRSQRRIRRHVRSGFLDDREHGPRQTRRAADVSKILAVIESIPAPSSFTTPEKGAGKP